MCLDEIVKNTDEHLEGFAKDGLRTLCIAKRVCIVPVMDILLNKTIPQPVDSRCLEPLWDNEFRLISVRITESVEVNETHTFNL